MLDFPPATDLYTPPRPAIIRAHQGDLDALAVLEREQGIRAVLPGLVPLPVNSPSLITDGLVSRWILDEPSGTTAADTGWLAQNGTIVGSPARADGPVSGRSALQFNGTSQYVTIPDNWYHSVEPTNRMSLCAFIYPTSAVTTNGVVTKGDNSNNPVGGQWEWALRAGQIVFWQFGGNNYAETPSTVLSPSINTWHHVCGTLHPGTALRFYLDGIQQSVSTSFAGAIHNRAAPVNIARRNQGDQYFPGRISDVRLYDRVLSAAEVARIAAFAG